MLPLTRPVDLTVLVSLFLCIFSGAGCALANKKLKDVLITVEYRPDHCDSMAEEGDKITVEYSGFLESGVMFDTTSLAERGPLNFTLGTNTVIPGLERGILGMCLGEKRKLVIPSHLAYGNQGYRTIPGDTTIFFDVELTAQLKKSPLEKTVNAVHFFFFPLTTWAVIFYLWNKMNSDEKTESSSNSSSNSSNYSSHRTKSQKKSRRR